MRIPSSLYPFLITMLAIALLSLMDAFMKNASLAVGAFSTLLWRHCIGFSLLAPVYAVQRTGWPDPKTLRLHLLRGATATFTAITFFSALMILPLAESIALSFISPLIALALAALVLKETVRPGAIWAALLGLLGVGVIVAGRIGSAQMGEEAWLGVGLVLASSVAYAWNLILQRQQSLRAGPLEITTFQSACNVAFLLPAAPWLLLWPAPGDWTNIAVSTVLGIGGGLALSWAYARAEAQVLVPVEYTGFLWAALFGWFLLDEPLEAATVGGALLIVAGCWIAAPRRPPEQAVL